MNESNPFEKTFFRRTAIRHYELQFYDKIIHRNTNLIKKKLFFLTNNFKTISFVSSKNQLLTKTLLNFK